VSWERGLLGYSVSILCRPLALVEGDVPDRVSLRQLSASDDRAVTDGRTVTVGGMRLPGWMGARAFICGMESGGSLSEGMRSHPRHRRFGSRFWCAGIGPGANGAFPGSKRGR
jgi:hypothetical protein